MMTQKPWQGIPEAHRKEEVYLCNWCGPFIAVDEDGCCTTCGEDAVIVRRDYAVWVECHGSSEFYTHLPNGKVWSQTLPTPEPIWAVTPYCRTINRWKWRTDEWVAQCKGGCQGTGWVYTPTTDRLFDSLEIKGFVELLFKPLETVSWRLDRYWLIAHKKNSSIRVEGIGITHLDALKATLAASGGAQ